MHRLPRPALDHVVDRRDQDEAARGIVDERRDVEGISYDAIAIDGKSGSTGSGARLRESGAHTWRSNVVAPYAPRGHRHVAEAGEALALVGVGGAEQPRLGMSTYGASGPYTALYKHFGITPEHVAEEVKASVGN